MKIIRWVAFSVLFLVLTACSPTPMGYRAVGFGPVIYEGQTCSLEQPWTVTGSGEIGDQTFAFTPTSRSAGTVQFTQLIQGCEVEASGTYQIEFFAGGEGDIISTLKGTQNCWSFLVPFDTVLHVKIQRVPMPECR